jgi:hypothetical protein
VNDTEIARLISLPKKITEAPSKAWKEDSFQRRKDFCLESADNGGERFRAFARQSTAFPENFSIGLEFEPQDGQDAIILIRCNGAHGDFNGKSNPEHPHFHHHVHRASSRAIDRGERAEKYAERTDQFADVKQAMRFFLEAVNVDLEDQRRYFEEDLRRTLFDEIGETE